MRLLLKALLSMLLVMIFLCHSQASIHIGGNDGLALLKDLTNKSLNLTGINNTTDNLSTKVLLPSAPKLIGNGGKVQLKNLTNSSLNLTGANNTSDLSKWGGKPLPPPVPTAEDYFNYQNADVVKANREE